MLIHLVQVVKLEYFFFLVGFVFANTAAIHQSGFSQQERQTGVLREKTRGKSLHGRIFFFGGGGEGGGRFSRMFYKFLQSPQGCSCVVGME